MEFNSKVKIILDRITNPNYPDRNLPDPYNRQPAAPEAPVPAAAGTWQPASDPAVEQAVQELIAYYNEATRGAATPDNEVLNFWNEWHQTKQDVVRRALQVNHKHTVAREILKIIGKGPGGSQQATAQG